LIVKSGLCSSLVPVTYRGTVVGMDAMWQWIGFFSHAGGQLVTRTAFSSEFQVLKVISLNAHLTILDVAVKLFS